MKVFLVLGVATMVLTPIVWVIYEIIDGVVDAGRAPAPATPAADAPDMPDIVRCAVCACRPCVCNVAELGEILRDAAVLGRGGAFIVSVQGAVFQLELERRAPRRL